MDSARESSEIDRFISNLMDESLTLFQTNSSLESTKSELSSTPLSQILLTDSSFPKVITNDRNSLKQEDSTLLKPIERKILSLIGSYFINPPSTIKNNVTIDHLKSINKFSLHHQFDSLSPSFHGPIKELTIDNTGIGQLYIELTKTDISSTKQDILKLYNKLKLYTNNHLEFLFTDVQSYTLDSNKQELHFQLDNFKLTKSICEKHEYFHESIKFAPKDKSNEVKTTIIEKRISYFQNDDEQQLIKFIQNEINNHQWPLQEYIGIKGQRAWRALKLAADIANLDNEFMLNYHNNLDWISTDNDFGSFNERTYLIIRNFQRRIEQEKLSMKKDNCLNNH